MAKRNRTFLTEGNRGNAGGRNTQGNQVILNGCRPTFTQCQVVFTGTALIRMAFQADSWGLGAGAGGERLRLRVDENVGRLDEDPFYTPDTGGPWDTADTGDPGEVN